MFGVQSKVHQCSDWTRAEQNTQHVASHGNSSQVLLTGVGKPQMQRPTSIPAHHTRWLDIQISSVPRPPHVWWLVCVRGGQGGWTLFGVPSQLPLLRDDGTVLNINLRTLSSLRHQTSPSTTSPSLNTSSQRWLYPSSGKQFVCRIKSCLWPHNAESSSVKL